MKYETGESKRRATERVRNYVYPIFDQIMNDQRRGNHPENISILHITHTDADGVTCDEMLRFILREHPKWNFNDPLVWKDEPNELLQLIPKIANHYNGNPAGDLVIISDLNFNRVHLEAMEQLKIPYLVLDHHISDLTEEEFEQHPNIICEYHVPSTEDLIREMNTPGVDPQYLVELADIRSAASILADVFFDPDLFPEEDPFFPISRGYYLSRCISSRDTFQHKIIPEEIREMVLESDQKRVQDTYGADYHFSGYPCDRYTVGNRLTTAMHELGVGIFMQYLDHYLQPIMQVPNLTYREYRFDGDLVAKPFDCVSDLIDYADCQKFNKVSEMTQKNTEYHYGSLPVMQEDGTVQYVEYFVGASIADGQYASDLGNEICTRPGVDLALIWTDLNSYSLRSIKETVNVQAIATCFGGGGHKHAAGFPCNEKSFGEMIQFFQKKELNGAIGEDAPVIRKKEANILRWKVDMRDAETDQIFAVDYTVAVTEEFDGIDPREICDPEDADILAFITGPSNVDMYLLTKDPSEEERRQFYRACGVSEARRSKFIDFAKSYPGFSDVATVNIPEADGDWLTRARFNGIMNLTGRTLVDLPIVKKRPSHE